jgi:hypothetical protein
MTSEDRIEIVPAPRTEIVLGDPLLTSLSGMGVENVGVKNLLLPRLTILQALSPQLNKNKVEYIPDAEIGNFCNVATGDIYKESVVAIPCYFLPVYIEWRPNRGGLVAIDDDNTKIVDKCVRSDRQQLILPNGNIVEETAQWFLLLQDGAQWTEVVFPLRATNLKHSRRWMTLVQRDEMFMPSIGRLWKPPLFWRCWRLRTVDDANERGDWATFRPEKGATTLELDPSRQLFFACNTFYLEAKANANANVIASAIAPEDDDRTMDVASAA